MPSSQLTLLCEQIEKQDTDHFGKFYMYVSLLNTVTVRNKTFADGLPQYTSGLAFWRDNKLNIGEISTEFAQQVTLYSQQFANVQPGASNVLYNIVMAYARKGKITDLIYIIDKMLAHLMAIHGRQSHNQNIYEYIHFDGKKESLVQFINKISQFNQQVLSLVDTGCNTGFAFLAATTGLALILGSVFALVPSLIGLGLLMGGAYSVYSYVEQVKVQAKLLEAQVQQLQPQLESLIQQQNIFGNKTNRSFFSTIVIPLPYAVITSMEQIAPDEATKAKLLESRTQIDTAMSMVN